MSGYTPVFDTVFQGTLCGKYPDLPVWLVLLALQQRGGIIDAHPSYIATISGLPQADIEAAIQRFCEPDPASRTADHDGRRLEPIEGAGFGWRVLNHRKYQEKARLAARTAREAEERKAALPAIPRNSPQSPASPPSDSDANSNTNSGKSRKTPAARACALPPEFELTEDRKVYAEKTLPNVDAAELMAAFRDYHKAKGTTARDWDASWRTYVRNGLKFGYPMIVAALAPPKKVIKYDARGRVIDE